MREVRQRFLHRRGGGDVSGEVQLYIRKALGLLQQRMRTTGQKFGAWLAPPMSDGTRVWVSANHNGPNPVLLARVFAPATSVVVPEYTFLFENGALVLVAGMDEAAPLDGDDPLPLSVHYGDMLSTYFAGPGTLGAVSGELFHLQGEVQFAEADFISDTETMPDNSPYLSGIYKRGSVNRVNTLLEQLSAERFYQLSPLTPSVTLSSQYTGLMRLAVQSWLGVGRSPGPGAHVSIFGDLVLTEAVDYPCPHATPDPHFDGLIYDDAYNFWWVRVGLESITFSKLRPARMEFAQEILSAGGLTAAQQRRYLLALLSWLEPDPDADVITVELPELGNVTGGGRAAVAHGWHFNHAAPWKAAIVTQRVGAEATGGNWYREATQAQLSFSFTNGIPSASLQILEQDTLFSLPLIHSLFYPSELGSFCALGVPLGVTRAANGTEPVPLYCFYAQDNTLTTLKWEYDRNESRTSESAPTEWSVCGPSNELYFVWKGGRTVVAGGFSVGTVDYSEGSESASQTYNYAWRRNINNGVSVIVPNSSNTAVWPAGTSFVVCSGSPSSMLELRTLLCGADTDSGWNAFFPVGAVQFGQAVLNRYGASYQVTRNAYYQFTVIPAEDAEAVFIGQHIRDFITAHDVVYSTSNTTYTVEFDINSVTYRCKSEQTLQTIPLDINNLTKPVSPNMSTTSTERMPEKEEYSGEVTLVSSRGDFASDSPPYPEWGSCLGYDVSAPCANGCGATASLGYMSGGFYSKKSNDNGLENLGEFNYPVDSAPRKIRWLGDA